MEHSIESYMLPYVKITRKITISCDTFGGFTRQIDVNAFNTKDEIIKHILDALRIKLVENDLRVLIEKLDNTRAIYHIHDYNFDYILTNDQEYYICNHNCQDT